MARTFTRLHGLCVLIASSVLAGCSSFQSVSEVQFFKNPEQDDQGLIKFYLASSDIVLGAEPPEPKPPDPPGGKKSNLMPLNLVGKQEPDPSPCKPKQLCPIKQVKAVVLQKEHKDTLYGIVPDRDLLERTVLQVTYFPNTRLIKQLGTQVVDEKVKVITALGAIATAVAIFGIVDTSPTPVDCASGSIIVPVVIDAHKARPAGKDNWLKLPGNHGCWWYRLQFADSKLKDDNARTNQVKTTKPFTATGDDSIHAVEFFSKYNSKDGEEATAFPFSSCRPSTLQLQYSENKLSPTNEDIKSNPPVEFKNLLISDPLYVQTLVLPEKGFIKMHDICGADLETNPESVKTAWDVLIEFANQVKAVKDAQKE